VKVKHAAHGQGTSRRARIRRNRRLRAARDPLRLGADDLARSLHHPPLDLLPRAIFNPGSPSAREDEAKLLDALRLAGVACEYEPLLFQMYDDASESRMATSPDLWLGELGMVIEIGCLESKARKIRLLREHFPALRFGLLSVPDLEAMPEDPGALLDWLQRTLAANDRRLEGMDKIAAASHAWQRAMQEGASAEAADAAARRAMRLW
jgi:hypothetical protein